MTLEEAKKILEKEFAVIGIHKSTEPFEFDESGWIEHEKPSVLEAFRVLSKEGYYITISGHDYDMRKKRLEKEYEKNTKAPGSGEEQPKEGDLKAATKMFGAQAREIMRLTAENAELRETIDKMKEGNPALKESASLFNDALLDEQAKKIEKLAKENERLKDQIAVLDACKKHNDKIDRLQIKRLGKEIARLNGIIHDKNEELKRKTKGCCELITENVDLKEKLADKVVDKIDAQALKSAESALAYKEKVIAGKDNVIGNLRKELKAQKGLVNHISKKYDGAKINLKLRMNECEKHKEVIEKLQKQLKYKSSLPSGSVEAINIYVDNISRARRGGFNKSVASTMGETELSETYEYGDKKLKYALHFNEDGSITFECSDPDKKNRHNGDGLPTPEEPKHDNSFKDFISKTIDNFNRRAAELGCVGSKDGNGILDQMFGVDIAEEGADHSGVTVLCGKDFIDAIKKMK